MKCCQGGWHERRRGVDTAVSKDRQATDRAPTREGASAELEVLRGEETAGGRGMTERNARMPKRGKNCQPGRRQSPSGGEASTEWGLEAGPRQNTRSCEKRSPPSPPTHLPVCPSIRPSRAAHRFPSPNILVDKTFITYRAK